MRYSNQPYTINNSGTTSTAAIDVSFVTNGSAQAVFTDGAAAGALTFQASNDHLSPPTNWTTVPSTSQTVTAGATVLIPNTLLCYRWLRATFVSTGGAGTIAITIETEGE